MRPSTRSPGSPWYRRPHVLALMAMAGAAVLLALLLFVPWVLGALGVLSLGGCSEEERAVLKEFPHYDDRQEIEPYPGEETCNARYPTRAGRDEVLAYYAQQLRENDWEVMEFWVADPPAGILLFGERLSEVSGAPESVDGGLGARRGEYRFGVTYRAPGTEDPEQAEGEEASVEDAWVIVQVTDEPGQEEDGYPK